MEIPDRRDIVFAERDKFGPLPGRENEFTSRVALRLATMDPRWGRKSQRGGPISIDTLGYRSDTPGMVGAIDIILSAGGPDPRAQWLDFGEVEGTWYPMTQPPPPPPPGDKPGDNKILEEIRGRLIALGKHLGAWS